MDYYESAEGVEITHSRALNEIITHSLIDSIEDFYNDFGNQPTYQAQDVLDWLGY